MKVLYYFFISLLSISTFVIMSCSNGGATSSSGSSSEQNSTQTIPETNTSKPENNSTIAGAIPSLPACSQVIPFDNTTAKKYRKMSYYAGVGTLLNDAAISNRGYRAVVGSTSAIFLFGRSKTNPLFSFTTSYSTQKVAISANGTAFVSASGPIVRLFECDAQTPAWSYDTDQDTPSLSGNIIDLAITPDGRYIAVVTETTLYLFQRDKAKPILIYHPTLSENFSSVALSDDGQHLAAETLSGESIVFLNQKGLLWHYQKPSANSCLSTPFFAKLRLSSDASKLFASSCDGRVSFWDTNSSIPKWQTLLQQSMFWDRVADDIALSKDANHIVVQSSGMLFYANNTAAAPDWSYTQTWSGNSPIPQEVKADGSWMWDGWWRPDYTQPNIFSSNDAGFKSDENVSLSLNSISISDDGHYIFVSGGNGSVGNAFELSPLFNTPLRAFSATDNAYLSPQPMALSPDGSWLLLSNSTSSEIVRYEVPPVEKVWSGTPVSVSTPVSGGWDVNYMILKPGRTVTTEQKWEVWPLIAGIPTPPTGICSGQTRWSFTHNLSEDSHLITATHNLSVPSCFNPLFPAVRLNLFLLMSQFDDHNLSMEINTDDLLLPNISF